MHAARRRHPARAGLVAGLTAVLLPLAACTGEGTTPPQPDTTATADAGPRPEDVVATVVVPQGAIDVEVGVHPVVRAGEHAVLTLDLTPLDELTDPVHVRGFGGGIARNVTLRAPTNVRLVDLERDVIHHPGVDDADRPVVAPADWDELGPAGNRLLIPYAAPPDDATSVSVFLPGAPLVAHVPVIDGDVPSVERPGGAPASDEPSGTSTGLDLTAVVEARTFPLDSTSAELEGAVQTSESTERVDVQLGADVLFEFDQATLTPAAADALGLVAERLTDRAAGTVDVVGHTDDQGDDAYNQDLSEWRAQAVADALAGLVDPSSYPTTVSGRGEAEPFVPNDSEENRARNRRVTVTLTSTVTTRTDVTVTGELPPFGDKGAVGTDGETLRVPSGTRTWEVAASARSVHGHVVVDLTARPDDEMTNTGWILGSIRGYGTHRGVGTTVPVDVAGRAVVLQSATKLFPMDYTTGPVDGFPEGEWLPVTDLDGPSSVNGGRTRTYSFVFPRMDVDAVTFQLGSGHAEDDLRLVDVRVVPDDAAAG